MKFKDLCNSFNNLACVVSIEKKELGYGEIRIVDGNDKYIDSIEHPFYDNQGKSVNFIPNSIYTDYLFRDLNFEDYVYRSAIKKQILHSYAYPEKFGAWFDMNFIPISYNDGDIYYCIYIMDIKKQFSSDKIVTDKGEIASRVLKTSLKLSNTLDFNKAINNVIKDIRDICSSDYCCILLIDKEQKKLSLLAEDIDINSKRPGMKGYLNAEFYNLVESWEKTIDGSNCLIIYNEKGMEYLKEKNPDWYQSLTKDNINSLVLFPLIFRNKLLGYIWAIDFKIDNTPKIKETLELTTAVLSSEISNYLMLKELTRLSSKDLLTGVNNRNELNNYMRELEERNEDLPISVIFLDINGLKAVNDNEGHTAGDTLIKTAAMVLCNVFKENEIYRAGGDEFTVIVENTTEGKINNLILKLKDMSKMYGVSFAIGYSLCDNTSKVVKTWREADEHMYEDKKNYYENLDK